MGTELENENNSSLIKIMEVCTYTYYNPRDMSSSTFPKFIVHKSQEREESQAKCVYPHAIMESLTSLK